MDETCEWMWAFTSRKAGPPLTPTRLDISYAHFVQVFELSLATSLARGVDS